MSTEFESAPLPPAQEPMADLHPAAAVSDRDARRHRNPPPPAPSVDDEAFCRNRAFGGFSKLFHTSFFRTDPAIVVSIWEALAGRPSPEETISLRGPRPVGSFSRAAGLYQWAVRGTDFPSTKPGQSFGDFF